MTRRQIWHIACELDDYVQYRAIEEGIEYKLSPPFFEAAIRDGCVEFFGIGFDRYSLIYDRQSPDLFALWQGRTIH